jgi:hypothetical protein
MHLSADTALRATEILAAIGVLVSSLEFMIRPDLLGDSSLLSWRVLRLGRRVTTHGRLARAADRLLTAPALTWLFGASALAAAALIAVPIVMRVPDSVHLLLLGVVVAGGAMRLLRAPFGSEGSDEASQIVLTALLLVSLRPTATAMELGLWFIALQGCLAYFTSGIYKITGRMWLSGAALIGVLGTRSYGNGTLAAWFAGHTTIARWVSRGLSLTETLFPLVLLAPPSFLPIFLAWGVGFHLTCAVVMGLDCFVWAFVATYPAIAYVVLR